MRWKVVLDLAYEGLVATAVAEKYAHGLSFTRPLDCGSDCRAMGPVTFCRIHRVQRSALQRGSHPDLVRGLRSRVLDRPSESDRGADAPLITVRTGISARSLSTNAPTGQAERGH